jgi:hypothetical protein
MKKALSALIICILTAPCTFAMEAGGNDEPLEQEMPRMQNAKQHENIERIVTNAWQLFMGEGSGDADSVNDLVPQLEEARSDQNRFFEVISQFFAVRRGALDAPSVTE